MAPTMLVSLAAVFWMSRERCVTSKNGCEEYYNNVGRAVQLALTLLRYASAITEQKKCWELLAQKFDRFQTFPNNSQQYATGNIQNVGRC